MDPTDTPTPIVIDTDTTVTTTTSSTTTTAPIPSPSPPLPSPISSTDGMMIDQEDLTQDVPDVEEDEPDAPVATAIGDEEDEDGLSDSEGSMSGDDEEGEEMRRKRRASRPRLNDYNDDESMSDDPEEYEGEDGNKYDLPQQIENESATGCGLHFGLMTPLEQEFLPEFISYPSIYLQLRNLICSVWQKSLTTYLTWDQFLARSRLDEKKQLNHCARRIFDFLNLHGFINSGLLPIAHDSNLKRPLEQQQVSTTNGVVNTPLIRRKSETLPTADIKLESPTTSGVKMEESKEEMKSPPISESTTLTPPVDANGDVAMKTETDVSAAKDEPASASPNNNPNVTLNPPPPMPAVPSSPSHKRILVIGAGASGLAAARQLQSFGHQVTVLEGRDRLGGRVNTIRNKFSAPVDLGASIMTGLYGSPLNVLSKQIVKGQFDVGFSTRYALGRSTCEQPNTPFPNLMHYIRAHCPLYDTNGKQVEKDLDDRMEHLWNKLLEAEYALKSNSGHVCEPPAEQILTKAEMAKIRIPNPKDIYSMDVDSGLQVCRKLLGIKTTPAEEKLLDWHAANLEYGCAVALKRLSLVYWDQDDGMAWEGDHALIKPGFGHFIEHLSHDIDIRQNQHVQSIEYPTESLQSENTPTGVKVTTKDNLTGVEQTFEGDYVLCTASLGVLKAGELQFNPPLPTWKMNAIKSLGFGLLNKLILEFPTAFWKTKNDQDMFGYVSPGPSADRGKFYIFWNLERSHNRPILAALCAGDAAYSMEDISEQQLVTDCMKALRAIHSEETVPDPIVTHQTKWNQDRYARGSYSFVAAGNNGKEYDILAKPVGSSLYFAGEACNRDYPATVPGAYLSGLRTAGQMQSAIFGWNKLNPGQEVLYELSRQTKSDNLSKSDTRASTLTQQAKQELQLKGLGVGMPYDLQYKIAEILARQKRRRGIRHEFTRRDEDENVKPEPAQEENIASKLEAAARMLKAGLTIPKPAPVTLPPPRPVQIHRPIVYESMDEPTKPDLGLPGFVSFHEFNATAFGQTDASAAALAAHESRRQKRHEKKRRLLSKDKHRSDKLAKKHKSSSSKHRNHGDANVTPEKYIHHYIGKLVVSLSRSTFTAAENNSTLLKQVQRKAGGKVVDDWKSKPRGSLAVSEWMNEPKRKPKVEELVRKYFQVFLKDAASAGAATTGPSSQPSSTTMDYSSNTNGHSTESNQMMDTTNVPISTASTSSTIRQPKFFPSGQPQQ